MSFDTDPRDKYQRFLLYHAESDSLFEVFSRAELEYTLDSEALCEDVTGDEKLEERFKKEKIEE